MPYLRVFPVSIFAFILASSISAMGFQKPEQESAEFQWLPSKGETAGLGFPTHKVQPLAIQRADSPPTEIEQEKIQVDAQTTRIIRKTYAPSANGVRQLTESVVEDVQKLPGNRVRAVRTVSRPDLNGRLSPFQQEIQDVTPAGADSFQINKMLLLPGMNNSLVEKERIQQIERRKPDKSVEIDRTWYLSDPNGQWTPAERRVSQNSVREERVSTEEQVYQYDLNNKLSLTQQIRTTELKDPSGRRILESSTYVPGADGKFQIDSRMTITQGALKNGRQETSQVLERPNPAAPGEGLKLVRKIVENLRVINPNETERQMDFLEPDANGGLRTLQSFQSIETK